MAGSWRAPWVLAALAGFATTAYAQDNQPRIGERVRIEGPVRADGSLVARRVSRRAWRAPIVIRGPIDALGPEAATLQVLGVTVSMRPMPLFTAGTPGDLHPGDIVEIEGLRSMSMIQATRIRRIARSGTTRANGYLEGDLQTVDGDGFVLLGQRAWLPAAAARLDEQAAADGTAPVIGRLRRDADDQQIQLLEGGRWLVVGGRVDASFVREQNYALEPDRRESVDRTTSAAQVQALVTLPAGVEAFWKIKARHRVLARDERQVGASLQVAEAYVSIRQVGGSPASLHIGRQRFRDARGWFFDVDLDAVRVEVAGQRWTVEGAVTEGLFAEDLSRRRRDQRHVIGAASMNLGRHTVTGRLLARDDRGVRGEKPVYVGVSAHGRIGRSLRYWSDTAVLRGRIGSLALRGWAADVGGVYQWRSGWRPALAFSYAVGSADRSPDDRVDGTFRPTALESSSYRLSGTKWMSYYGQVLDPDLSNLQILTAAFSVRPSASWSIEGVYHQYTQLTPTARLGRNNLGAVATGRSPEIGHEVDAILAFRRRPLDISLVTGVFLPGRALDPASRPAILIKPQVRVYF